MSVRKKIADKITSATDKPIVLSNMSIKDDDLDEITHLIKNVHPDVRNIYFDHNVISDKGALILLESMHVLKDLEFLDLQFNQLSIEGAKAIFALIRTHPNIEIALAGNKIEDASEMNDIEMGYRKNRI